MKKSSESPISWLMICWRCVSSARPCLRRSASSAAASSGAFSSDPARDASARTANRLACARRFASEAKLEMMLSARPEIHALFEIRPILAAFLRLSVCSADPETHSLSNLRNLAFWSQTSVSVDRNTA